MEKARRLTLSLNCIEPASLANEVNLNSQVIVVSSLSIFAGPCHLNARNDHKALKGRAVETKGTKEWRSQNYYTERINEKEQFTLYTQGEIIN